MATNGTAGKVKGQPVRLSDFGDWEFPPRKYLVPGFLPERTIGATAGRPVIGKTPLLQQWALAIAQGETWTLMPDEGMSTECRKVEVLWLGLERGPEVLHEQFRAFNEFPPGLHVEWDWPRLSLGGETYLENFLKANSAVQEVFIDHWGLFKPPGGREGMGAYDDDYEAVTRLRSFIQKFGAGFELICHANQGKDPVDFLAAFYGNTGFVGAVDVRRLLKRGKGVNGTLQVQGTGVAPDTHKLVFDYPRWRFPNKVDAMLAADEEDGGPRNRKETAYEALLQFGPKGASRGEWFAQTGLRNSTFNRALQALVDENWVIQPEGARTPYVALTFKDGVRVA